MTPDNSKGGKQMGSIHMESIVAYCFFSLTQEFEGKLFSLLWASAYPLYFEALLALFQNYLKVLSFLYKAFFCLYVLIRHFSLMLKSDCFNWNWLAFRNRDYSIGTVPFLPSAQFPLENERFCWKYAEQLLTWLFWHWTIPVKLVGIKPAGYLVIWIIWVV